MTSIQHDTLEPVSILDRQLANRERRQADERRRRQDAAAHDVIRLSTARHRDGSLADPGPERLTALYDRLAARIDDELLSGATRHRRVGVGYRMVPAAIALLDWVVLVPYGADILNADLTDPWSLRGLAAGLLAALGSGAGYLLFTLTGHELRGYRTPLGDVAWRAVGSLVRILIAASLVTSLALGVLMYLRVLAPISQSPDPVMAAWAGPVALAFAVLNGLANLAVVAVHALDGSTEAALLRRSGRLLLRRERAMAKRSRALAGLAQPASPGTPDRVSSGREQRGSPSRPDRSPR